MLLSSSVDQLSVLATMRFDRPEIVRVGRYGTNETNIRNFELCNRT